MNVATSPPSTTPRPPGVMPMPPATLAPANASSTAPHGIAVYTAANDNARQTASSSQLSADNPQAAVHKPIEGRTCESERAVWQNPRVSLLSTPPAGPKRAPIQSRPRTSSLGYLNSIAAPAEPANTTASSGSRIGSASPRAITAPGSASAASAQNAIAPTAS